MYITTHMIFAGFYVIPSRSRRQQRNGPHFGGGLSKTYDKIFVLGLFLREQNVWISSVIFPKAIANAHARQAHARADVRAHGLD